MKPTTFEHINLTLAKPNGSDERFERGNSVPTHICVMVLLVVSRHDYWKTESYQRVQPTRLDTLIAGLVSLANPIKLSRGTRMKLFLSRKYSPQPTDTIEAKIRVLS